MTPHDELYPATKPAAIGQRLHDLRMALGYQPFGFSHLVDIDFPVWLAYEQGCRRISRADALKVLRKTGVTTDWIFYGDERRLQKGAALALARFHA